MWVSKGGLERPSVLSTPMCSCVLPLSVTKQWMSNHVARQHFWFSNTVCVCLRACVFPLHFFLQINFLSIQLMHMDCLGIWYPPSEGLSLSLYLFYFHTHSLWILPGYLLPPTPFVTSYYFLYSENLPLRGGTVNRPVYPLTAPYRSFILTDLLLSHKFCRIWS